MKIGIVGRVNVGKSTLFNRILGTFRAIVTDIAGTTREIISEKISLSSRTDALLLDSPGLLDFNEEIVYIDRIIKDSDIIVFVVDGKAGLTQNDHEIKDRIITNGMKERTIVVVNKLDSKVYHRDYDLIVSEFYNLGFTNLLGVSAKQGEGVDTLKEELLEFAKSHKIKLGKIREEQNFIPLAIVGRPNVGKSTLINKFAGDEISKVSPVAGTTLDYLSADINYHGKIFRLYDTVGVRKRGKIAGIERIALDKTLSMLKFNRPAVIFLLDVIDGVTHRDMSLLGELMKLNLPLIIAANKTDTLDISGQKNVSDRIARMYDFAKWIPIIPISAANGAGLPKLLDFVEKIWTQSNMRIGTGELNKVLNKAWIDSPPRFPKNKVCKFYYITQVENNPPRFKVFINKKAYLNFAFKKWFENVVRKSFGFIGIPIVFDFEEKDGVGRYSDNKK